MPDFVFVIKTTADLAAADAALAELKELKRQAIAAGVATGDLDSQITKAEAAIGKFSKEQKAGGVVAKDHEEKIHGLNKAMGLLARTGGEVGHALHNIWRLGGNPLTLGLAVLSIAIGALMERFRRMKEEVEDTRQKLLELNRANFDTFVAALGRATAAQSEYNTAVNEAGQDKDKIKTLFDQRIEFLEAEIKAIGENIKAQEELTIARYKAAHSGEDTTGGEAKIRAGFANQRTDLNRAAGGARISLMEEERTRRDDAGPLIDYNTAKNRLRDFDVKSSINDPRNYLNQLKAAAPGLDKRAGELGSPDEYKKTLASAEADYKSSRTPGNYLSVKVARDAYKAAQEAADAVLKNATEQAKYTRLVEANETALAQLKEAVVKAKAAYESNASRVTELDQKIGTARGVQAIENNAADQRKRKADFAPVLDTGLAQAEATAGKVGGRQKISAGEGEQMRTLGSMVAGQSVNVETAAKMFSAAKGNKQIEADFLSRLMAAVERLAAQSGGDNSSQVEQLMSRLAALESQVANQSGRIQNGYNQ